MAESSPQKLAGWLYGRLVEGKISEYMSSEELLDIIKKAVKSYYRDGKLETKQVMGWFNSEFGVPFEDLFNIFLKLKDEAAGFGFVILMPGEEVTGKPGTPPEQQEEQPAGETELAGPSVANPFQDLPAFIKNTDYMVWAFLDHVCGRGSSKVPLLETALSGWLKLSDPEKSVICSETVKDGQSAEALVLELYVRAAACGYVIEFSAANPSMDVDMWMAAVQQAGDSAERAAVKASSRISHARKEGREEEAKRIENVLNKLRSVQKSMEYQVGKVTGAVQEETPSPEQFTERPVKKTAPKPPPRPKAKEQKKEGLPINKVVAAVLGGVLLLVIAVTLWATGVIGGGISKVKMDYPDLPINVSKTMAQGSVVVLYVDDQQWINMEENRKKETIAAVFSTAQKKEYRQLHIKGNSGEMLATAFSPTNYRLLY